jgi:predicted SprT family Zn-dependent metalloprotease
MNRTEVEDRIHQALAELATNLGLSVTPRPVIVWDLKGTSVLGQAFGCKKIRLHAEALDKLGAQYLQTALHEAAHVAVSAFKAERGVYDRSGQWSSHGAVWQRAMRSIGLRPDRCATLPTGVKLTPARTVARYVAKCACRDHVLTAVKAKKIETYVCRACNGPLILTGRAS